MEKHDMMFFVLYCMMFQDDNSVKKLKYVKIILK